jgi:methylthioxylose transferase
VAAGAVETAIAARRDASRVTDTRPRAARVSVGILAAWAIAIVVAHVLLERIQAAGANIRIQAAPLVGTFELRVSARLLAALAIGTLIVFAGPRLAQRVEWRTLLVASAAAAALWAVSLALVDGGQGLMRPLEARTEYLTDVVNVGSPTQFLSTFVERIGDYSVHVQGHPPGMLLLLSALDRIGLGGSGWAAALCIAGGAAAVPAVLIAVREVAGEGMARRAAPFLLVAPAAIWVATSADAFFMGVSAWAVALVVLATGRLGRRSDAYALAGVGARRPYLDFLVANAACLAIALGPAVAVALARLRDRRLWLLVGGTLVVVGAAMISGMSKGEVERIWLPFAVWLLPAGAVLAAGRERITTGWLGLQAITAIVVASVVKTSW